MSPEAREVHRGEVGVWGWYGAKLQTCHLEGEGGDQILHQLPPTEVDRSGRASTIATLQVARK